MGLASCLWLLRTLPYLDMASGHELTVNAIVTDSLLFLANRTLKSVKRCSCNYKPQTANNEVRGAHTRTRKTVVCAHSGLATLPRASPNGRAFVLGHSTRRATLRAVCTGGKKAFSHAITGAYVGGLPRCLEAPPPKGVSALFAS